MEFLKSIFDERRIVIIYDLAAGIKFINPEMEKDFKKVCGLESEDVTSADPVAAAKAGLVAKRGLPQDPSVCLPLIIKTLRKY